MSIAENIAAVRSRIAAAAASAGRRPEDILLVGASKMNDAAACREAIAGGLTALGENRVQELLEKDAQGAYAGAALHFIGRLQRNKVKYLVGRVDLIESIDSSAWRRSGASPRTSCWRSAPPGRRARAACPWRRSTPLRKPPLGCPTSASGAL